MKFRHYQIKTVYFVWLTYAHVLGLAGIVWCMLKDNDAKLKTLYFIIGLHFFGGLGITAGAHRLWAHQTYDAKGPYRCFLMLLNSMAFQGSIFHWSRDHRLHHKFSDTELDPHSMERGFFFSHVGWLLVKKSKKLVEEGRQLDMEDLKNDPYVMFQKKYYYILSFLFSIFIPGIIGCFVTGESFMYNMILGGFTRYIIMLNSTWCVNSVCHMFGTRPYNQDILPTENFFVSVATLGQGWHNWHHEYPQDWRASKNEWWMFNPTTTFIQFWELMGQVNTKIYKVKE